MHFECPAVSDSPDNGSTMTAVVKPPPCHRHRSPSQSSSSNSSASDDSVSDDDNGGAGGSGANSQQRQHHNVVDDDQANSADTVSVASAVMGAVGGAVSSQRAESVAAATANLSFDDGAASVASHRSSPASYAGSNSSQIPIGSSAHSLANRRRSQQLSGASSMASSVGPSQWPVGALGSSFPQGLYVEEQPPPQHQQQQVLLPGQVGSGNVGGAYRSGTTGGAGVSSRHVPSSNSLSSCHNNHHPFGGNHPQTPTSPTSSHSSPSRAAAFYDEDHFHLPQAGHSQVAPSVQVPQMPQGASQQLQGLRAPSPSRQQQQQQQQQPEYHGPTAATGAVARRKRGGAGGGGNGGGGKSSSD